MAAPFDGTWIHEGVEYRDMVIKMEIVTSDDEKVENSLEITNRHLKKFSSKKKF